MEFFLFPTKDKGGFWKQVDKELQQIEEEMREVEADQRPQAWVS
jgi:hypothetical protein